MSALERNKQLARDFIAFMGAIDLEGMQDILAEDLQYNIPNTGCTSGQLDRRRFLKTLAGLGMVCPGGVKFQVLDLTAEGDRVSIRVDGLANLADGTPYNNRYHFLIKIRDGKIFEAYEYYDALLVENLIGPLLKKKPA
ncbi:MAG: nuclear transport factor 2 family protein [Rhodocyclaceae bacterium]|jgi:ketosteroid isomerase-like protein|nr:nuclear transport factor 2 family protein [Rhodocyclaceae bacterium]